MTKPADYLPKHCRHKSKNLGFVRIKGRTIYTGSWGKAAG